MKIILTIFLLGFITSGSADQYGQQGSGGTNFQPYNNQNYYQGQTPNSQSYQTNGQNQERHNQSVYQRPRNSTDEQNLSPQQQGNQPYQNNNVYNSLQNQGTSSGR